MRDNIKQTKMLLYIQRFTQEQGYPPSLAEIASHVGVVKSHALYLVHRAGRQGLLEFSAGVARSYRVL